MERFTEADLRLIRLLAQDLTVGEAAIVLGIDEQAARMRIHRLRLKFHVRTTHVLLLIACQAGAIELPQQRR